MKQSLLYWQSTKGEYDPLNQMEPEKGDQCYLNQDFLSGGNNMSQEK